jgi:ABC-2 type transport system ATP-binding protein
MSAYIDIQNLSKQYKDSRVNAVDNLCLKINPKEIFGLLGPNGAGKTTTISILCHQITASSGHVVIDGKSLHSDSERIKKIIGVVPQDIALYPKLTATENLRFFGNMYGLNGKYLKNRIDECALQFGLESKLNKRISTFSGGMKRRINLIAGLLHKPKILFLDEPTVGIDVQSKNVIIEHLKELNYTEGTTIIYTSHMMDEAERFCTHIAILDNGKVVTEGQPAELIRTHPGCQNLEDIFLLLTGKRLRD